MAYTSVNEKPRVSPWVVISLGIAAVSTASIFIRFAQRDAPSLVIAAFRLTIASLVLAPVALTRHPEEFRRLSIKQILLLLGTGAVLALHFASWISSLEYTSVATSVVLVTTTPLWVAIFSPLVLHEKITQKVVWGLVIALVGGIIVSLNNACQLPSALNHWVFTCTGFDGLLQSRVLVGNVLALVGALSASLYMLAGRSLRSSLSIDTYTFSVYGTAAVVLLLICLATRQPMAGYPPRAYLWFTALALVPQLLGHSSFNWALKYLPAATVSVTLLGEPIGSTILAFFVLSERPGILELSGLILIMIGIYLTARR